MINSISFATATHTFKQQRSRSMSSQQENNVERTGVAQVKSRQLDTEVPKSEIILGGVELYKD